MTASPPGSLSAQRRERALADLCGSSVDVVVVGRRGDRRRGRPGRREPGAGGRPAVFTVPLPGSRSRDVFALPQQDGLVHVGLTDEPVSGPVPDDGPCRPRKRWGNATADLSRKHLLRWDGAVLSVVGGGELRFAVRHERARSVADLLGRRTRIGLVPADRAAAVRVAERVLAEDWSGTGSGASFAHQEFCRTLKAGRTLQKWR